jgi:DNA gyrase subunit A
VDLYFAHTLDHVLFFTNRGRVYGERVFALPDTGRDARGMPMVNFLNLAADERVTTLLVAPDFAQAEYVSMVTRMGRIKRVKLSEFASVRPSGIIAVNLEPGDELGWVRATFGDQDFIVVTTLGRASRFKETEVRSMGRTAAGVRAIRLGEGDVVAGFDVVEPGGDLLVLTERGWGKRTPLSQYPMHSRSSQGVWALAHSKVDQTGKIVAARVVQPNDQVSIITAAGVALRTPVANISQQGRTARGVRIVSPDDGDAVAAMARLFAAVEGAEDRPETLRRGNVGGQEPQPEAQDASVVELAVATSRGQDDATGDDPQEPS